MSDMWGQERAKLEACVIVIKQTNTGLEAPPNIAGFTMVETTFSSPVRLFGLAFYRTPKGYNYAVYHRVDLLADASTGVRVRPFCALATFNQRSHRHLTALRQTPTGSSHFRKKGACSFLGFSYSLTLTKPDPQVAAVLVDELALCGF